MRAVQLLQESRLVHSLLLIVIVGAVFATSLGNGFVWDDNLYMATNPVYRTGDVGAIFRGEGNGVEYLPVRDLSHCLEFFLWGDAPLGFHLVNWAIYLATVILVYAVTRRVAGEREGGPAGRGPLTALLVALLFALHPLHSEAVSWINCRNALLSGLFFFAAAAAWLRFLEGKRRWGWYVATFLLFILALFSKATAIVLPLFLLVLSGRTGLRRVLIPLLPLMAASVAAIPVFTAFGKKSGVIPHFAGHTPLAEKLLLALQIPSFYLEKFLLPVNLSVAYDTTFAATFAAPRPLLSAAGLALLTAAAVHFRRSFPSLLLWGCGYLVLLLPALNLYLTHPVVADRYAYLPLYPLCFLLVEVLHLLFRNVRGTAAATVVIAAAWGTLAAGRNPVWRSDEALWRDAVTATPRSAEAHYNLGDTIFKRGRYEEAMAEFRIAQDLHSWRPYYDFYVGVLTFMNEDFRSARTIFAEVLARDPGYPAALFYAADTAERLGNRQEAAGLYRQLIATPEQDFSNLKLAAREQLRKLEGN